MCTFDPQLSPSANVDQLSQSRSKNENFFSILEDCALASRMAQFRFRMDNSHLLPTFIPIALHAIGTLLLLPESVSTFISIIRKVSLGGAKAMSTAVAF
jgi:hypothetical protein